MSTRQERVCQICLTFHNYNSLKFKIQLSKMQTCIYIETTTATATATTTTTTTATAITPQQCEKTDLGNT